MIRTVTSKVMGAMRATVFAVGLAVVLALLLAASPAHAKTFTVNSTQDFTDDNPGDGVCDAISSPLLNPCTLRAAIQETNAFTGADTINFDIPGSGVKTIKPNLRLPAVTDQVTIDGYTQGPASENTLAQGNNAILRIELDGSDATGPRPYGLLIGASNSVVKGLVINRFGGEGIRLSGSNNKVEGNFIGTDPGGTIDRGNLLSSVVIVSGTSGNTVGGTTPETHNLISGNSGAGVRISSSSSNKVQGNLIGTSKDGTSSLGNGSHGVLVAGNDNLIGGADTAANIIAFNHLDGVSVAAGTGNRILSNSIRPNGDLGIDLLGGDETTIGFGVTKNDPKDPDTGPNNLQNYPVLTSATPISGNQVTITGTLNSRPEKTFTIQFFSNLQQDPSTFGAGRTFLGQKKVETNNKGNASFTFTKTVSGAEERITATATGGGGTSEFSKSVSVM